MSTCERISITEFKVLHIAVAYSCAFADPCHPSFPFLSTMAAAEHPADQHVQDPQWEERTRPSREAPRVNSLYLRKDYTAACPQQHLAYLKCMKDSKSWLPFQLSNACQEEWKAFAACKSRAKAVHVPPEAAKAAAERPSYAALLWQDFQREPNVIAFKMSWHNAMCTLGLDSYFSSSDSSSDGHSTGSSDPNGSTS